MKNAEKRQGRQCERHAQNVGLEKRSVRNDGDDPHYRILVVDSRAERSHVSRISPLSVKELFLVEKVTAVCGMAMVLSSQKVAISLETREI